MRNKVLNVLMVEIILDLIVGGKHGRAHRGLADIQQLGLQLLYRKLRNFIRGGDLVTELGLENILNINNFKIRYLYVFRHWI